MRELRRQCDECHKLWGLEELMWVSWTIHGTARQHTSYYVLCENCAVLMAAIIGQDKRNEVSFRPV